MTTVINASTLSNVFGALSKSGPREAKSGQAVEPQDPFEQQLYSALANSLSRLGVDGSKIEVNVQETERQNPGVGSSVRQFLITLTPVGGKAEGATAIANGTLAALTAPRSPAAVAVPPGQVVNAAGKIRILRASDFAPDTMERLPPIPSNNLSVHDYEDPVPELVSILHSMGIDTSRMSFELYDDVVSNIGGNYTNHLIRTDIGNGMKEDFSVEWTLRNPRVTAVEIARMLKMQTA